MVIVYGSARIFVRLFFSYCCILHLNHLIVNTPNTYLFRWDVNFFACDLRESILCYVVKCILVRF